MAKHTSGWGLSTLEQVAGALLLLLYLLVFPYFAGDFFALVETALSTSLSAAARSAIYYYTLLVIVCLTFHRYLSVTSQRFSSAPGETAQYIFMGLVGFYGLSELFFRLAGLFDQYRENFVDSAIFANVDAVTPIGFLIIVIVAPIVEEVLFRGVAFGALRPKNTVVAYAVSMALYALSYVLQYVFTGVIFQDLSYVFVLFQALVAGFILCWCYDRSATLWAPIIVHALVNAMVLD